MTILRSAKDLESASTADLLETYNAMTGKDIKKFSSRAAGELQTANAIMAAIDAAGHLGVAKGKKAEPMTVAELEAAKASRADRFGGPLEISMPKTERVAVAAATKTGAKASLRVALAAKAGGEPNKPKPKAEKAEKRSRERIIAVVPTYEGDSKLQAQSQRKGVYDAIVAMFEAKGNKSAPVSIDALQEHMGDVPVRPYVFKLVAAQWLTTVNEQAAE